MSNTNMETPPSTPPREEPPPSLADTASRSLSSEAGHATAAADRVGDFRQHGSADPSTPLPAGPLYATPSRGGEPGGAAPRSSPHLGGTHGLGQPPAIADLTPVIRNSGNYVDAHLSAGRPGLPQVLLDEAHATRGLQLRRLPLPKPKRGGGMLPQVPPTASVLRGLPPAGAPSVPSHPRDARRWEGAPFPVGSDAQEIWDGPQLSGAEEAALSMPSYSDEPDASSGGRAVNTDAIFKRGDVLKSSETSVFRGRTGVPSKQGGAVSRLAPVELTPDRKIFSFQGASQYKRQLADEDFVGPGAAPKLATIICSPSRPPPATQEQGMVSPAGQYQPPLRGQHGVREMANAEDLDAIFKAPRKNQMAVERTAVVSPHHTALKAPESGAESLPHAEPYPLDDRQWSIPSIKLATRVQSSSGRALGLDTSCASFADYSVYTDEGGASLDESYYSFLDNDIDNSLSSRGSLDASARRRRRSGIFQKQRVASREHGGGASDGGGDDKSATAAALVSPAPAFVSSDSFLEQVRGISIEHDNRTFNGESAGGATPLTPPTLFRRASTFDLGVTPPVLSVLASATSADEADLEQTLPRHYHSLHGSSRRRSRRRRRDEAALEWLQELRDGKHISEAASSKFMNAGVGGGGVHGTGNAHGGQQISVAAIDMNQEDVVKALGLPHPLCRSTTIEAGRFVRHAGVGFGQWECDGVTLESNSSMALTSSGSGD